MQLNAYLCYNGQGEEAIEFYREALGAKVLMLSHFKDMPESENCPAGVDNDKVMHATLQIGESILMLSDGCEHDASKFEGFSLSLAPADEVEARRLFDALADGGEVQMPLEKTFWSPCFGMTKDRFGVSWMVNVSE